MRFCNAIAATKTTHIYYQKSAAIIPVWKSLCGATANKPENPWFQRLKNKRPNFDKSRRLNVLLNLNIQQKGDEATNMNWKS